MSKHRTVTRLCPTCSDRPVSDATICRDCGLRLERNLGDISALADGAHRVFATDDRMKGSDDAPLVRSRSRRRVSTVDPVTGRPVLELEPLAPSEFGREPSMPWEVDRGLAADVDTTLSRQAVMGTGGGKSGEKPVPFHDRAGLVRREAHARLGGWVRDLHDGEEPWPADDLAAFSRWLLARMVRLVAHPAAEQVEADVWATVRDLRGVIDRPADRWYAGPCDGLDEDGEPCREQVATADDDGRTQRTWRPTELYAAAGAAVVRCRRCGTEYDVAERRAWLLAAVEDQLAHAELIGRAAPTLGVDITPAAVRGYANRGLIVAHGTDLRGRPLYRIGDVIDVARDVLERRARRTEKAAAKDSRRSA